MSLDACNRSPRGRSQVVIDLLLLVLVLLQNVSHTLKLILCQLVLDISLAQQADAPEGEKEASESLDDQQDSHPHKIDLYRITPNLALLNFFHL